jgi:hypothetical protein
MKTTVQFSSVQFSKAGGLLKAVMASATRRYNVCVWQIAALAQDRKEQKLTMCATVLVHHEPHQYVTDDINKQSSNCNFTAGAHSYVRLIAYRSLVKVSLLLNLATHSDTMFRCSCFLPSQRFVNLSQ